MQTALTTSSGRDHWVWDCKKRKHAEGGKDIAYAATDEVKKLKETHEQQLDDMRHKAAVAGVPRDKGPAGDSINMSGRDTIASIGLIIYEMTDQHAFSDHAQSFQTDLFDCASNTPQVRGSDVCRFIDKSCQIAEWSPTCSVYALVLLTRLHHHGISLTWMNWNRLLFVALLISQKMLDDNPLANTDFPVLWAMCIPSSTAFTAVDLCHMEFMFAKLINWDIHVTNEVYTEFMCVLYSMHLARYKALAEERETGAG
jgi:hypothetical protein